MTVPDESTPTETKLSLADYRRRVLGCWLGKAVGGTLGGPVEGEPGPLNLSFYEPVPTEMMPNDDLDLQVVWLETIRRRGLPVDRQILSQAWLDHIQLLPDEYGVAVRNLQIGIRPPLSGQFDNGFTAGMGAAIRTELWACLAPGDPELAAQFAGEDARVDHDGEGVYAAIYLAVLESLAFVDQDRERLLDAAAAAIPPDCRVARAIADTRAWWAESGDWAAVRLRILEAHGRQNFTDVAQNLAFIVLGWLAGRDFGDAICIAVNCGEDTDCTGATLGSILGILDPASIGEEWLAPIGREMVLSPGVVGLAHAPDLDVFTDQVLETAGAVQAYYERDFPVADLPSQTTLPPPRYRAEMPPDEAMISDGPLLLTARMDQIAVGPGETVAVTLRAIDATAKRLDATLEISPPPGWQIDAPTHDLSLAPDASVTVALTAPPVDSPRRYLNRVTLTFNALGLRWTESFGLAQTVPWRRADGDVVEAAGRSFALADGPASYTTELKLPYHCSVYRLVAQAPRPIRVLLDGQEILSHDGSYRVPAIHRPGDSSADFGPAVGWHRLTVEVGDGTGGELFCCIGMPGDYALLTVLEHRLPTAPR